MEIRDPLPQTQSVKYSEDCEGLADNLLDLYCLVQLWIAALLFDRFSVEKARLPNYYSTLLSWSILWRQTETLKSSISNFSHDGGCGIFQTGGAPTQNLGTPTYHFGNFSLKTAWNLKNGPKGPVPHLGSAYGQTSSCFFYSVFPSPLISLKFRSRSTPMSLHFLVLNVSPAVL